MTRFAVFDLASVPYPGVVESLDIEAIVTSMRDDLVSRFPAIIGVIDLESETGKGSDRGLRLPGDAAPGPHQRCRAAADAGLRHGCEPRCHRRLLWGEPFRGRDRCFSPPPHPAGAEAMPHGGTVGSYSSWHSRPPS